MPKTPTFELDIKAPKKGNEEPSLPNAQISVKNLAPSADGGAPILNVQCATFKELDAALDLLIEELKGIRKTAKRKFKKHKKEQGMTKEAKTKG
jgi:hypothetical protein